MSGRNSDAGADEDAETDGRADAHAAPDVRTDAECDIGGENGITLADRAPDAVANRNTVARVAEPWTRNSRPVRVGGDDRCVGMDLASIPELSGLVIDVVIT